MPSPEHAADLERLLARAAQECESQRGIWFGEGLPKFLQRSIAAHRQVSVSLREPAEIAFIEVSAVSPKGEAVTDADTSCLDCPVIGLSTASAEELGSLICAHAEAGVRIRRLISPFAVFDFGRDGIRVREIRHGLTAADLQAKLSTILWAGPDLKELGSH
jgi:acyl CoA:acetate/3-ketoacid CoA transferase beta subunit